MLILKTRKIREDFDSPSSWRLSAHIASGDISLTNECRTPRQLIRAADKLIRQLEEVKRVAHHEQWKYFPKNGAEV
jgi:hypothetical protein